MFARIGCLVLILFPLHRTVSAAETTQSQSIKLDSLGDPLPPGARLRLGTVRFRHPSTVAELALSPDDRSVATIGREWLILWDTKTGREMWRVNCDSKDIYVPAASYGIRALAFSPDGEFLYTPAGSDQILQWHTRTGRLETIKIHGNSLAAIDLQRLLFNGPSGQLHAIDVSPDGKLFVAGSGRGLIVTDSDGKTQFQLRNNPAQPITVDDMNSDRLTFAGDYAWGMFSPPGDVLAVVLSEAPQEIRLLNSVDGTVLQRIQATAKVVRMAFSPDGEQLVTTERDCGVRQYHVATGNRDWEKIFPPAERAESYTSAIAYSNDGKLIAACAPIGSDYAIYLIDAATGKQTAKLTGHRWKPWGVSFSSDCQTLYSSGWDGVVRRWNVATGEQMELPIGTHATGVTRASPTEPVIAFADDRGVVHLVDSTDGNELQTLSLPGVKVTRLAYAKDGSQLAVGGTSDHAVHVAVWALPDGTVTFRRDWDKGREEYSSVDSLEFAPDSKRLAASVFRQDQGFLWDITSGDQIANMKHGEIFDLAFSPDGQRLITVGWDTTIQLWNATDGTIENVALASDASDTKDDFRVYSVSYSPVGDLIATAHIGDRLVFWQADGMVPRNSFRINDGFSQQGMEFSPDGLWLAAGLNGGGVAIWDPFSGEEAWHGQLHQDSIEDIQFVRSDGTLLTGASDGCCYLWDIRPEDPAEKQSLAELWDALAAGGAQGFEAFWALCSRDDEAVPFLGDQLTRANELVDLEYVTPGQPPKQIEQEQLRRELLVESRASRISSFAARRALSILVEIGSAPARQVLEQLANRNPADELNRLAAAALARCAAADE